METGIYRPILDRHGAKAGGWSDDLSRNYRDVTIQISTARAVGRRLRRNYAWILIVQAIAYYLKLIIHPVPMTSLGDFLDRAAVGPIPGVVTIGAGMIFHITWLVFAVVTLRYDRLDWNRRSSNNYERGG